MSSKKETLKQQIEYYLSDANLQTDDFFRKEISSNTEGFVNLNVFQKCNKIKKLGVTVDEICEAIKESTLAELNPTKTGIRRKNNLPLPEFQESRKKIKTNEESEKIVESKPEPIVAKEAEPLIFTINAEVDTNVDWKAIRTIIEKEYGKRVTYVRYDSKRKQGNFSLDKNETTPDIIEKIEKSEIAVDNVKLKLHLTVKEELETFWQEHGGHYNLCLGKEKNDRKSKKNSRKEKEKKQSKLEKPEIEINFLDKKYKDPSKLKNFFKQLLSSTRDGEIVAEPNHTLLKNLLENHEKKDEKLKDLKSFTAGVHPEHSTTRCFFIVKQDGSKEDFSLNKCIENLVKNNLEK